MKWFASSVFWKASIVCSPSFCMERACGSVRVCNCGSRIWISITARSSCGRARSSGSGLDVRSACASTLSHARAWWLKDQAEGRSGVALPDALERSIRAPGILAVVLGFCAAHAFDRSTGGVVRRHHMYDQTFQRAFKRAVEQAGITKPPHPRTPSATRSRRPCSAAVTTFEPCRICSAIPTSTTMIYACAKVGGAGVRSPLDALPPLTSER